MTIHDATLARRSTATAAGAGRAAHTGARKRTDASLVGQLNREWDDLRDDLATARTVGAWSVRQPALAGCTSLSDVEARVAAASRTDADAVLLALLELAADHEAEEGPSARLAGRTVLQLMLGKAVRIAASNAGRDDREALEHLAVAALWDVIATYPIHRRRQRVAANLSMDTLRQVVGELSSDRHESPVDPETMSRHGAERSTPELAEPVDLEVLEVLAWGVDHGAISRADAALLTGIYCTDPDGPTGPEIAAGFGISWAAARQRCSRAARKLAAAVREDALEDVADAA